MDDNTVIPDLTKLHFLQGRIRLTSTSEVEKAANLIVHEVLYQVRLKSEKRSKSKDDKPKQTEEQTAKEAGFPERRNKFCDLCCAELDQLLKSGGA
jgi:hypothetical protein